MQYDVYPNPSSRMQDNCPYVMVIQSDLLTALATRMVVPLAVTSLSATSLPRRLCLVLVVQGQRLMLVPFKSAPLDKRYIKDKVGSAREHMHGLVAGSSSTNPFFPRAAPECQDALCVLIATTAVRFSPTRPASRLGCSVRT